MKFFRKRESTIENITLMAMFAALNAIISLFGALFGFSAVFLVFIIPVTSAFVASCCKGKYLPIYVLSSIGVSIAVSAWDFSNTLFYTLPALITGTLFGYLNIKRKDPVSILFIVSLVQLLLFYLSTFPIKGIYGISMEESLLTLIGQKENPYGHSVFFLFLFAYAVAQMTIAEVITHIFIARLFDDEKPYAPSVLYPILSLVFLGAGVGIAFLWEPVGFLLIGFGIYWSIACIHWFFPKPHWSSLLVLGIGIFATFILFGLLWRIIPMPKGFVLFSLPFASLAISSFLNVALLNLCSNNKM